MPRLLRYFMVRILQDFFSNHNVCNKCAHAEYWTLSVSVYLTSPWALFFADAADVSAEMNEFLFSTFSAHTSTCAVCLSLGSEWKLPSTIINKDSVQMLWINVSLVLQSLAPINLLGKIFMCRTFKINHSREQVAGLGMNPGITYDPLISSEMSTELGISPVHSSSAP